MRTFKDYTTNRPVLGVIETIVIEDVGKVLAKIDSGNEAHNVLHGVEIQDRGNSITFNTVNDKQLTLRKTGEIDINIGSGNIEKRPTVSLNFKIKNQLYHDITFSIADRADNEQQVLIGEPFIRKINALIDVKIVN